MNLSDFITNQDKKDTKAHYLRLIQVSKADGTISQDEFETLHKEGRKFGLTDPEIDQLINMESKVQYEAPYSLDEKFEHLVGVARIILTDGKINDNERKLIRKFAVEAGFDERAIDKLLEILFVGIVKDESEEDMLVKFRRFLFVR
jgi:uncharacterized tellurite resistance protein B-like protein